MAQQQDQGPCFLVIGIVFFIVGLWWLWPLAFIGGLFFFIGLCIICQEQNKAKTQPAPEPVAQPAAQPVAQPVAQPAPQPHLEQKFCPHCGAKTIGDICSDCGSPID